MPQYEVYLWTIGIVIMTTLFGKNLTTYTVSSIRAALITSFSRKTSLILHKILTRSCRDRSINWNWDKIKYMKDFSEVKL